MQLEYNYYRNLLINSSAGINLLRHPAEYITDVYQCGQRIPFYRQIFNGHERIKPVGMGRGKSVYVRRNSAVRTYGSSGQSFRCQSGAL